MDKIRGTTASHLGPRPTKFYILAEMFITQIMAVGFGFALKFKQLNLNENTMLNEIKHLDSFFEIFTLLFFLLR